jgi:hypothetical protein
MMAHPRRAETLLRASAEMLLRCPHVDLSVMSPAAAYRSGRWPCRSSIPLIRPQASIRIFRRHIMREDPPNDSEQAETDPDAGLSRAERRAKARGKNPHQAATSQPHFVPKNNQAAAKRNYSNRRSG